jgi:crossover junction endodeoxyribonuclease RusA
MNENVNGLHLMLPFPEAVLNPNKKVHWSLKYKAAGVAREAAFYLTLEKGVKLNPERRYIVNLVFCPPDKRTRDLDNLTTAMKSALDGMCQGLGINDKMIRPLPDWGPQVQGGKVEVTIKEIGA